MQAYDVHQHLLLEPHHGRSFLAQDRERRVRIMDRNDISRAIVSPLSHFDVTNGIDDVRRINDLVADYVSMYSDRFPAGCGVVHLRMREACLPEIERAIKDLGLKGIAWHHMSMGTYIDDPITLECVGEVARLGGVPLIHAFAESMWEAPWRLGPVAEAFPGLPILVLSGLFGWSTSEQTLWLAKKYRNLVVDTCVFPINLWVEKLVRELGSERVLFGSDLIAFPEDESYHHAASLSEIRTSPQLGAEEKQRILSGNVQKLFSL